MGARRGGGRAVRFSKHAPSPFIVPGPPPRFQAGDSLARPAGGAYHDCYSTLSGKGRVNPMSIDKSLRRKNTLARARNVLTRGERIKTLQDEERWQEGRSPFGLPKVRVVKIVVKKKAKKEEKAEGEGEAAAAGGAAAPAAGGA